MRDDEARALLSVDGLRLLDEVGPYRSGEDVLRASARMRREGHDPALVAAVLTQSRLRQRAQAKFGEFAERMLFTEAGLEQATRLSVAAVHAGRFAATGMTSVADLGCGIGGDALALAALDIAVTAVDRDEITAAFATYNLVPFPSARVRLGTAEDFPVDEVDAVFLDPARRETGSTRAGRLSPDAWSPSLDFAFGLAERVPTGVKLAPGMDRDLLPDDAETQWVTADGETVEVVVWRGALARPRVRRAALVLAQGRSVELVAPQDSVDPDIAPLGRFIHEPAGSVIRARLLGDLAEKLDAGLVHPGIAYLTGDEPSLDALAASFEVEAVLPLDERTVARELRSRDIGSVEIKKRGVDIDPATFRKKLGLRGPSSATLILTRLGERRAAILAHRVG